MLLQANIHFQDKNDNEKITSTLCKNGKELQDAVGQAVKDKQKVEVFLDNLYSKVFAVEAEMIKVPPQDQAKFYEILYHLACSKEFKIIAIVLSDKVSKNISQIDGSLLTTKFSQDESQNQQQSEQKRVPLPLSQVDYKVQQEIIRTIDTKGKIPEGNQVYSITINEKTTANLFKNNRVKILTNFPIQQVHLFEIYLQWTDTQNRKQIQMTQKPEPRAIRISSSKIESVKLAKANRFETSFDLNVQEEINWSAIFVINNEKIVYEFPFTFLK